MSFFRIFVCEGIYSDVEALFSGIQYQVSRRSVDVKSLARVASLRNTTCWQLGRAGRADLGARSWRRRARDVHPPGPSESVRRVAQSLRTNTLQHGVISNSPYVNRCAGAARWVMRCRTLDWSAHRQCSNKRFTICLLGLRFIRSGDSLWHRRADCMVVGCTGASTAQPQEATARARHAAPISGQKGRF